MAQIIRLRRGTLAELNSVTLQNGEIGIVTGSAVVGDAALKSAVVVGHSDGTNRLSIARIITGNATPDLSGETGGSAFNNMLYHETDAKALKVLNTGGNTTLDLSANISVSEIAGNISGSVSSTGSFGYLNVDGDAVIGGNLTFGDAASDSVTFGADITSNLIPDASDSYNLGSNTQRWNDLYLSGSISASGGHVDIDSATTIAMDSVTTTAINATTTLTAKGATGASFGDDTGTWEFDGAGALSETGMTTFSVTPSSTLYMQGGGVSRYGDDTGYWSFDGSGAVSETGMTTVSITPSSTVDVDAGGAVTIDSSAAAISVGGDSVAQKISIGGDTSTRTEVELNAILVDVNAGSGGVTIDAGATSNLTTSAGDIDINAAANLDLDGATVDIDSAAALSLQAGATSDFTTSAGDIDINAAANLDLDGATVDIDSAAALSLQAGAASDFTTSAGALTLNGAAGIQLTGAVTASTHISASGNLYLTGTADIDGNVDIDNTTTTIDSTSGVSIDAGAASNLTTSAGALTLDGGSGVNIQGNAAEVDITTSGAVDINSGAFTLNGSTVGIDGTSTLTMGASEMDIDADGGIIDIDATSTITIGGSNATGVTIGKSDTTVSIPGSLDVNGTLTTIDTTNLRVADRFIQVASGSTTGDGGIIVTTAANGSGSAMFWDDSALRWGLTGDGETGDSQISATPRQYAVSVSGSAVSPVGSNPSDFGASAATRIGMMHVNTATGDIFIFS